MGSRSLQRDGHRVVAYDARGHGASSPAPSPDAYGYETSRATCSRCSTTAGSTARCWPAPRWGRTRSCASRSTTATASPASSSSRRPSTRTTRRTRSAAGPLGRALREGLREGGVEGFVEAYGTPESPERWHETIFKVLRQRLSAHEHPEALADALRAVPRSRPFEDWSELAELGDPRDRRRQPRRGRPRAPVRGRRALRRGDPRRGAALGGARAAPRWPGRAASSRRSSPSSARGWVRPTAASDGIRAISTTAHSTTVSWS